MPCYLFIYHFSFRHNVVCISIGEQMLSCVVKLIFASSSQAKAYKGLGVAAVKMVQTRELCGNITTSVKGKYNFKEEYINRVVSEPAVCSYIHKHIYFFLICLVIVMPLIVLVSGGRNLVMNFGKKNFYWNFNL